MIEFSIIIPAKNEQKHITNCLNSILGLDYNKEKIEIILVDNGSSDSTVEIAKEKGAKVFIKPDMNISGLRNFGSSKAKGKILAFVDADCTVSHNWLKSASKYINMPGVAAFGSAPIVPNDSTWVQRTWFQVRKKGNEVEEVNWLESMNLFVPATLFFEVGGFNEQLVTCEDYELSTRLNKVGKIISDQRIVVIHHGEAATIKHFFQKERWRATSNYRDLEVRQVDFSEWPSIFFPILQFFMTFIFILLLGMLLLNSINGLFAVVFLVIWQLPVFFLAFRKTNTTGWSHIAMLSVLLNIYLYARGTSFFDSFRRR